MASSSSHSSETADRFRRLFTPLKDVIRVILRRERESPHMNIETIARDDPDFYRKLILHNLETVLLKKSGDSLTSTQIVVTWDEIGAIIFRNEQRGGIAPPPSIGLLDYLVHESAERGLATRFDDQKFYCELLPETNILDGQGLKSDKLVSHAVIQARVTVRINVERVAIKMLVRAIRRFSNQREYKIDPNEILKHNSRRAQLPKEIEPLLIEHLVKMFIKEEMGAKYCDGQIVVVLPEDW